MVWNKHILTILFSGTLMHNCIAQNETIVFKSVQNRTPGQEFKIDIAKNSTATSNETGRSVNGSDKAQNAPTSKELEYSRTTKNKTMGTRFDSSILLKIVSGDYSAVLTLLVNTLEGMITGDGVCSRYMRYYFDSLNSMEMWALQMLDASGKPQRNVLQGSVVWLGAYDDCRKIHHSVPSTQFSSHGYSINGGYLKIFMQLPENITRQFSTGLGLAMSLNEIKLRWDVCIPESCKSVNMTEALNTKVITRLGLHVVSGVFQEPRSMRGDAAAYASLAVLGVFILLCAFGTGLDLMETKVLSTNTSRQYSQHGEASTKETFNEKYQEHAKIQILNIDLTKSNDLLSPLDGGNIISSSVQVANEKKANKGQIENEMGLCKGILLAFSVGQNGKKILDCSSPPGSLSCLHGIRVLSMTWVILGHFLEEVLKRVENKKDFGEMTKTYWFQCVTNSTLSVDSFFLLSGLLVCYTFMREVSKTGTVTARQMELFYFHRFWRLTPLYMIVLMVHTNLTMYMTEGPMVDKQAQDIASQNCRNNWWQNILYINNLFMDSRQNMCMRWSWYLANDMQFYIISPLALIPLALGYKVMGYLVLAAMLTTHFATSGYFDWEVGTPGIVNMREGYWDYFDKVYDKPYARVGVYAIGLLTGYVIHQTRHVKRLSKIFFVFGPCIAIIIGILCTYVTYDYAKEGKEPWSNDSLIAFDTLFRPGWAIAVSFLIFICVRGYGGFINNILSWKAWLPLSRLTYAAYLVHLIVITVNTVNMRGLGYMNGHFLVNGFISTIALSYAVSFVFSLVVEAPCLVLEKRLIKK